MEDREPGSLPLGAPLCGHLKSRVLPVLPLPPDGRGSCGWTWRTLGDGGKCPEQGGDGEGSLLLWLSAREFLHTDSPGVTRAVQGERRVAVLCSLMLELAEL